MITGATVHLATPPRPASPRTGRITDPGRAQSRLAGAVPLERRQARNKVQQPGMDYTGLPAREIERLARSVSPGNWAVERERPLSTLLGSCIAVCLFDPQARVGGINHFMLPSMKRNRHARVDSLLAGDFAMEALLNALLQQGARKQHMRAKAFGGGTIINSALNIGLRNADFAREWLAREGIPLLASDFLGPWMRKVLFLPGSGEAYCRRMESNMVTAAAIVREERAYAEALKVNSGKNKIEIF